MTHSIAEVMPKVLTELPIDRRQSEAETARVWNNLIEPRITAPPNRPAFTKGTMSPFSGGGSKDS